MAGTSSASSSSSCASFGSFDEDVALSAAATKPSAGATLKFLCSYGGKILPRYPDGKLRYIGGDTRVLAVDRSIAFSELKEKMRDLCGWDTVCIRCQLPTEDLDALVVLKCDEDLVNIVEVYDLAGREKIRAFFFSPPSSKPSTPPTATQVGRSTPASLDRCCVHQISAPVMFAGGRHEKAGAAGDLGHHHHHCYHHHHHHHHHRRHPTPSQRPSNQLVHHGNHWQ